MHNTEISPVAAIVGGILAQDVLRTLSAMELPIQNWFYYNGLDGKKIKSLIRLPWLTSNIFFRNRNGTSTLNVL